MKRTWFIISLCLTSGVFAEGSLREAIDKGDFVTAQKMVKNGYYDEIYLKWFGQKAQKKPELWP